MLKYLETAKTKGLLDPIPPLMLVTTSSFDPGTIGPKVDTVPELLSKLVKLGLGIGEVTTEKVAHQLHTFVLRGSIIKEPALHGLNTWAYNDGKTGNGHG